MINRTLFCVYFILFQVQAQNVGEVYDKNNIPIEDATIYLLKNMDTLMVTSTGQNGNFEFNTLEENYDILITHINYKDLKIKYTDSGRVYYLEPLINQLSQVEIKKTSEKNSFFKKLRRLSQTCGINLLFEDELATYIPSTSENLNKRISKLKFELTDTKGIKNNKYLPFRACIYTVDSVTGKPDKKIYRSEKVSMKKSQKWFKVDIDALDIRMPEQGLFIAIEVLPAEEYNNLRLGHSSGWWIDATPTVKCRIPLFKEENLAYHFISLLCSNNRRTKEECWTFVEGQYYMEFEFKNIEGE